MPIAATAKRTTTPRKRRTRKVTTTSTKSVTKVTPKKLKRPAKTVLTLNHYVRDYQSRVKIHNYEFTLFLDDCKKGLQIADKSVRSFYQYATKSYKSHFNVWQLDNLHKTSFGVFFYAIIHVLRDNGFHAPIKFGGSGVSDSHDVNLGI